MSKPDVDHYGTYTYKDYLTWDGPDRWELIDGRPHLLASPTPEHQQAAIQIGAEFAIYLRGKSCQVFIAPMDLSFQDSEETQTVVQPDLFVMCGDFQHDKRVVGVPVLVIEILSPSTAKHDLIRKLTYTRNSALRSIGF